MLYTLACIALLVFIVYEVCNGILRVTGWTDPKERKAATVAVMTSAIINSKGTKK